MKHFQNLVLDYKLDITQRFNILVTSIACNHRSHVFNLSSLGITSRFSKLWISFMIIVILKFMITFKWICVFIFSFNNYILKPMPFRIIHCLCFETWILNYYSSFWPTHYDYKVYKFSLDFILINSHDAHDSNKW